MSREVIIEAATTMHSGVKHGKGLLVGTGAGARVVVAVTVVVGAETVVAWVYVSVATEVTMTGSLGCSSLMRCWAPAKRPAKTEDSIRSKRQSKSKKAVKTDTGSCIEREKRAQSEVLVLSRW
jgi:hypothetical protein